MSGLIDFREQPNTKLSSLPAGTIVTGINGTDSRWRVVAAGGPLKKLKSE